MKVSGSSTSGREVWGRVDTDRGRRYTAPNLVGWRRAIPIYGIVGSGPEGRMEAKPMGMWVGRGRKARVAYGFDDIALVPGAVTINPNEVDISWEL